MSDNQQLTPYDQLPASVALNPYVREIYVRLKLIEDGRAPAGSAPRKEKMKIDWKIAVIVICLSGSAYVYYSMFFGSRGTIDIPMVNSGEVQRLEAEIRALEQAKATQSGDELATTEANIQDLKRQLAMTGIPGMTPALIEVPPGGAPTPGEPAH